MMLKRLYSRCLADYLRMPTIENCSLWQVINIFHNIYFSTIQAYSDSSFSIIFQNERIRKYSVP